MFFKVLLYLLLLLLQEKKQTKYSDQIQSMHSSQDYLPQHKSASNFSFNSVNEECISMFIVKLKNNSSYGYDSISNKLIKSASHVLVKPLTLIVNQSLHTGVYPS